MPYIGLECGVPAYGLRHPQEEWDGVPAVPIRRQVPEQTGTCKYNRGIQCAEHKCDHCGWRKSD